MQYEQYLGGLSNVAAILAEPLESTDFAHASEGAFDPDSAWKLMQERSVGRLMTAEDIAAPFRICVAIL